MKNQVVDENVFRARGIQVDIKYPTNPSKDEKERLVDKALKKFKKKVKDSGIMLEIYARGEFRKPSAIKREQKIKSQLRAKAINKINNK
jgi:ribosomal protein S21